MFWGLVLEPGKRYSTTVEKSFHVSKAALDCQSVEKDGEILSVVLETEGSESLLCNLCKQKGILQETLDLNFMAGDRLTFECRGHGRIHLTGYLLPDEDDDMSGLLGDEDESEEEEEPGWKNESSLEIKKEKRKSDLPPDNPSKKKKIVADEEEGDSDEDNESELSDDMEDEDMEDEEDGEEADDDEEEEEEESDEDEDSAEEKQKNKNKTPNKQQPTSPKKTPITNGITPKEQKSNKKTPGGGNATTPNANATPKHKQMLEGGVVVKDIKTGNGPPAKPGKMLEVYYVGKLKDTQKVFDKTMKGEGFKFRLGKGEVIKGWDIGLQGMKVGGKRMVTCPPGVAYGAKGAPPKIPPNSSLMFEIELRKVH